MPNRQRGSKKHRRVFSDNLDLYLFSIISSNYEKSDEISKINLSFDF